MCVLQQHGNKKVAFCRFAFKLDGVDAEIGPGDAPAGIPAGSASYTFVVHVFQLSPVMCSLAIVIT